MCKRTCLVFVALAVAGAACGDDGSAVRDDAGDREGGPPSSDGGDDGGVDAGPTCGASLGYVDSEGCAECQQAACCRVAEACAGIEDCVTLRDCLAACDSPHCAWACWRGPGSRTADGYVAFNDLRRCAKNECAAECELGTRLACAGSYDAPDPPSETGSLSVTPFGLSPIGTIGDVTIRACPALSDLECTSPIDEATTTRLGGGVRLDGLAMPFTGGYFEAVHADSWRYRVRLWPASHVGPEESPPPVTFSFGTEATLDMLAEEGLGLTPDTSLGMVLIRARDCHLDALEGARYELEGDPDAVPFYVTPDLAVSGDATGTSGDVGAIGGFIDVQPGTVSVRALGPDDDLIGELDDVAVRAGEVVALVLHPQPR